MTAGDPLTAIRQRLQRTMFVFDPLVEEYTPLREEDCLTHEDVARLIAIAEAAQAAFQRDIDEHSTDYDREHRWTDEAEGREHLWAICQAFEALDNPQE